MAAKRRKHSEDFKRDAVASIYKSNKSLSEIAEDLGINRSVLARSRREFDELGSKAFPGNGLLKLSPLEEENLRLKRELADVKEERDILKSKCTSSQGDRNNLPVYLRNTQKSILGRRCAASLMFPAQATTSG